MGGVSRWPSPHSARRASICDPSAALGLVVNLCGPVCAEERVMPTDTLDLDQSGCAAWRGIPPRKPPGASSVVAPVSGAVPCRRSRDGHTGAGTEKCVEETVEAFLSAAPTMNARRSGLRRSAKAFSLK